MAVITITKLLSVDHLETRALLSKALLLHVIFLEGNGGLGGGTSLPLLSDWVGDLLVKEFSGFEGLSFLK